MEACDGKSALREPVPARRWAHAAVSCRPAKGKRGVSSPAESECDSRKPGAILKPIQDAKCPVKLDAKSVRLIVDVPGGYPYFIQFICREVYDAFLQKTAAGEKATVPIKDITRKLDNNFFAGRWAKATDRQRELLSVIADLADGDEEFTVQEVSEHSRKTLRRPFSASHVSQMLAALSDAGLVYKNRHGRYSFAVPLLG